MGKGKLLLAALAVGVPVSLIIYSLSRPPALGARFAGFRTELIAAGTTTRQSTGQEAIDFRFYPRIILTPDVNGDFTVTWRYANLFNGAPEYATLDITNVFTGLTAGVESELELRDTRPENDRNESIAIGDVDFIALGAVDGLWHSFQSNVSPIDIVSPSGAHAVIQGKLGPEDFKCVLAMSARFAGFNLVTV